MFTSHEILRTIFKMYPGMFAKTEIHGCYPLPQGPKIIAANHTVASDALHIPLAIDEELCFLVQANLFEVPILGPLLKLDGHIPVKPSKRGSCDALTEACQALADGKSLFIFPEGRLVPPGTRVRARSGVMRLALQSGAPIIPLGIYVPPQNVLTMSTHWLGQKRTGLWQITGTCHMKFGTPWKPLIYGTESNNIHALTEQLMADIYSLVAETEKELSCASPTSLNPILP